jgi:hypothetical protein
VAFWRRLIFEEKKGRRLISEKKLVFHRKNNRFRGALFGRRLKSANLQKSQAAAGWNV